jgi:acylphosphatase
MMAEDEVIAVRVVIEGRVQRVGFRYWVSGQATTRQLQGWVRNNHTGEVEAVFSGPASIVEDMISVCHEGPESARVVSIQRYSAAMPTEKIFQTLPTV